MSSVPDLSSEEQDQLHRSVKKHKRDDIATTVDMHEVVTEQLSSEESPSNLSAPSFVDALTKPRARPPIYTDEGEEDMMDDLGMADILQEQEIVEEGELCPIVEIPWDSYKQSWQQWRRALIIRVFGKSFNFRVLEPPIRKLWHLEHGCKLIDLDKGYVVARFFSQQDNLTVINGGP